MAEATACPVPASFGHSVRLTGAILLAGLCAPPFVSAMPAAIAAHKASAANKASTARLAPARW
ncbi:MAG TPA: hypothetical protein VIM03_06140 [Thermoleophilaceae bacterium]